MSKTTIIRRFGSKEGLFNQLMAESTVDLREEMRGCLARADDPPATIEAFVEIAYRYAADEANRCLLTLAIAERGRFPELASTAMAHALETFTPISDYLARLMDRALIERDNPVDAAFELIAMANHGFRMLIGDAAYRDGPGRTRAIAARFLRGRGYGQGDPSHR